MRTAYSAGYSTLSFEAFCGFVERERLVVADVRFRPFSSRNPTWNRNALRRRLGDRYASIPELGNVNYKGGPIVLQYEVRGLEKLRDLLHESSVVVLCVCVDPAICHRTVVLNRLASDVRVQPLPTLPNAGVS